MSNKTREEKLKIAIQVYKEIQSLIDSWENRKDFNVDCCWDRCIGVDDVLFHPSELEDQ